ncbi:hypothetical protein EDC04DRAFT_2672836 [Pisolithus marmoratus]|nr:hypothetical protein EDC04DRAFT_2672836 [Pisolithus marmoratus]
MSYRSWTPAAYGHGSAPSVRPQPDPWTASGSPAPILPGAPYMSTVSLPHPNSSSPHYASAHYDLPTGAPRILALNPLLSYSVTPPIYFNVLQDMRSIRLRSGCSPSSLQDPALNRPVTCLCIRLASYPFWSIEVSNPHGVTVLDVLLRIREALHRGVSPQEATVSHTASEYFRARTRTDPREYAQGVKRVDFLGPNVFFAGLSPSMDGPGRWDVHFVPTA